MSHLDLGTWKKGILKHKEKPSPCADLGGSQSGAPGCPLSPAPTACGDTRMATASLPGKAAPGGWGIGKRSSVGGLMAAVNRSDQRHYRFLLCGAVIRLNWGRGGVGLRQQKKKLINKQTSTGNVGRVRRQCRRPKITGVSRGAEQGVTSA